MSVALDYLIAHQGDIHSLSAQVQARHRQTQHSATHLTAEAMTTNSMTGGNNYAKLLVLACQTRHRLDPPQQEAVQAQAADRQSQPTQKQAAQA